MIRNRRFQCSSASRKFLNPTRRSAAPRVFRVSVLFSEPKIPQSSRPRRLATMCPVSVLFSEPKIPQCRVDMRRRVTVLRFSALQRAENSSMVHNLPQRILTSRVSVLFSEPKIPQCSSWSAASSTNCGVSVLFSEPKIPQSLAPPTHPREVDSVSVLFSEPKIPQFPCRDAYSGS